MNKQEHYILPDDEFNDLEYDSKYYVNNWEKNPDDPIATLYCIRALRWLGKRDEEMNLLEAFDEKYTSLDHRIQGMRYWLDREYVQTIQCFEKCHDSFSHICIGILTSDVYPTHDSTKSFEYLSCVVDRGGVWFQKGKSVAVPGVQLVVQCHERDVQVAQYYLGRCYEFGYDVEKMQKVKDLNEAIMWYRISAQQGNILALKSLLRLFSEKNDQIEAKSLFKPLQVIMTRSELTLSCISSILTF